MNVKKLTLIGFVCLTSLITSLTLQQVNIDKINKSLNLKSGVGTCFERVSQSFTALMSKNISSMYLSKTFLNTTSECIADANSILAAAGASLSKRSSSLLNQFGSDYYWLSQKSLKLKALISSTDINLEASNVNQKFAALNDTKTEFSKEMNISIESFENQNISLLMIASSSVFVFLLSFAFFILSTRRNNKYLKATDKLAAKLIEDYESEKSERLFTELFQKLKLSNVHELHKLAKNNVETIERLPVVKKVPEIETANLAKIISKRIEAFGPKILSLGVGLDVRKLKEFHVKGEEDLIDQLIFHSLNYSLDFSKEKRVSLETSLLGSIAVFKIKLNSHCFNTNELDFLNSDTSDAQTVNLDLKLLKELTQDLDGSFAVRNKVDAARNMISSEIEFLFTVPAIRKSKGTVKLLKGTKKEILAQINSEA